MLWKFLSFVVAFFLAPFVPAEHTVAPVVPHSAQIAEAPVPAPEAPVFSSSAVPVLSPNSSTVPNPAPDVSSVSDENSEQLELAMHPPKPIQGEPAMVTLRGIPDASAVSSVTFAGEELRPFAYRGAVSALIGFDLKRATGTFPIAIRLKDGQSVTGTLAFGERKRIEAPLGIPESLGGNTTSSQNALVTTLAQENAELASVVSATSSFFTETFVWPVASPIITDEYGYSRTTGAYDIPHKGTDFKADVGTKVFAANHGVVRVAKEFRNYGNTVIIDHGAGILTFYMHLSRLDVGMGDMIRRSQLIGLSGQTGYATGPHLHFTVRVNGVSIDPVTFFKLFE